MSDACWERIRAQLGLGMEGEVLQDCWACGSREVCCGEQGLPGISDMVGVGLGKATVGWPVTLQF